MSQKRTSLLKRQNGNTLVLVLFALSSLSLIGATTAAIFFNSTANAFAQKVREQSVDQNIIANLRVLLKNSQVLKASVEAPRNTSFSCVRDEEMCELEWASFEELLLGDGTVFFNATSQGFSSTGATCPREEASCELSARLEWQPAACTTSCVVEKMRFRITLSKSGQQKKSVVIEPL